MFENKQPKDAPLGALVKTDLKTVRIQMGKYSGSYHSNSVFPVHIHNPLSFKLEYWSENFNIELQI
jgi:hypothetical protein